MLNKTKMRCEVEEIPDAIYRLLIEAESQISNSAEALNKLEPQLMVTIARGSSDHAAAFLKYAFELYANIPVASIGPSIASVYGNTLSLKNAVSISISQSGRSPDIIQMARSTKNGEAKAIAITNDVTSPLAGECDFAIDIQAGMEQSVAATKTFVTSIVAGLLLLAKWQKDQALFKALLQLPTYAQYAIDCDWGVLSDRMQNRESLIVLGRGPTMAIANEVALKFKETCQIHAEAYSSAEVLHGPASIIDQNYPVLALASRDASLEPLTLVADDLASKGADVYITSTAGSQTTSLPFCPTGHPLTDPLMSVISFYSFVEKLARSRGLNPDAPPNLNKITQTI